MSPKIRNWTVASVLLLACSTPTALAGSTSSSGGEMIKDQDNPWFIQNTKAVGYCIAIDETKAQLAHDTVKQSIERALIYWKNEIKNAFQEGYGGLDNLEVGTQEFSEVSCADADLKFQFGVLDDAQRKLLGDPRTFVAAAIRESYDRTTMKGRGFIYMAPETGADMPVADNLIDHFWHVDGGKRLDAVLRHEVGHVFGLAHSGGYHTLMSAGFPESIVTKSVLPSPGLLQTKSFLSYGGEAQNGPGVCVNNGQIAERLRDRLGIPAGAAIGGIWTHLAGNVLEIYASPGCSRDDVTLLGSATLDAKARPIPDYGIGINIYLPPEQAVFSDHSWNGLTLPVVGRYTAYRTGHYRSVDGSVQRELSVTIRPLFDGPISMIYQGAIVPDILH